MNQTHGETVKINYKEFVMQFLHASSHKQCKTIFEKKETSLNSNKSKCNQIFYFPLWENGRPTEVRKRTKNIVFIRLTPKPSGLRAICIRQGTRAHSSLKRTSKIFKALCSRCGQLFT